MRAFRWSSLQLNDRRFLQFLAPLFGAEAPVEVFHYAEIEPDRIDLDGLVLVRGTVGGRPLAVAWTDFRVQGGSLSRDNGDLFAAFLQEITDQPDGERGSLVLALNTLGLRFTQGRTIFNHAFQLLPQLLEYRKSHPVIALALGRCLGFGAILFGLAHYRLAVAEKTHINLTGPEVLSLFFGDKHGFEEFTSVEHQIRENSLVHEIRASSEEGFARAKEILNYPADRLPSHASPASEHSIYRHQSELDRLLDAIGEDRLELFPQLSSVFRVYLARRDGRTFCVVANPFKHPNNLITVKALDKWQATLDLCASLALPIVAVMDTPGGDPRPNESDRDAIMKMVSVAGAMIEYPYPKMGIAAGRCFSGSGIFSFPRIFGAQKSLLLDTATIGIIAEPIVNKLIENSPRMREEWERTKLSQRADLGDLIAAGVGDRVIRLPELGAEIDEFLRETAHLTRREPALKTARGERMPRARLHLPKSAESDRPA